MTEDEFVRRVIEEARSMGCKIKNSRNGKGMQIDFGHKKLNEEHLRKLFPIVCVPIEVAIERVARGRSCTHVPMREIIRRVRT